MNKITKLSIARQVFAEVHLQAVEQPREVFIARLNALHLEVFGTEAKPNLAPSYYQMLKYEADNKAGGCYRHHKGQRVGTKIEEVNGDVEPTTVEEPIAEVNSIPEDAKWKVTIGEVIHYFASRDAARSFKKDMGGKVDRVA